MEPSVRKVGDSIPRRMLSDDAVRFLVEDVAIEPVDNLAWRTETDLLLSILNLCPEAGAKHVAIDPATMDLFKDADSLTRLAAELDPGAQAGLMPPSASADGVLPEDSPWIEFVIPHKKGKYPALRRQRFGNGLPIAMQMVDLGKLPEVIACKAAGLLNDKNRDPLRRTALHHLAYKLDLGLGDVQLMSSMIKDVSKEGKQRRLRAVRLEVQAEVGIEGGADGDHEAQHSSDEALMRVWADKVASFGVPQEEAMAPVAGASAGVPVLRVQLESLNPNAKDVFGSTPLHAALNTWSQVFAADPQTGLPAISKAAGDRDDSYRWLHTHIIASVALLGKGAKPNAQDKQGNTPLHVAAATHNIVGVHMLLAAGANATLANYNDLTPLHYAAHSRRFLINEARQAISYERTAAYSA